MDVLLSYKSSTEAIFDQSSDSELRVRTTTRVASARDARRTDVEIDVDDDEDDDEGEPLLDENAGDAPSRGRDEDDRGS